MPRIPRGETVGGIYHIIKSRGGNNDNLNDTNGNIIKEIVYDTYGNILSDTSPSFKVPFGFAGGLHDKDTNLVHFGYREYDPFTGKWTAKDPIYKCGFPSVMALLVEIATCYGYVLGDPVKLLDLSGVDIC